MRTSLIQKRSIRRIQMHPEKIRKQMQRPEILWPIFWWRRRKAIPCIMHRRLFWCTAASESRHAMSRVIWSRRRWQKMLRMTERSMWLEKRPMHGWKSIRMASDGSRWKWRRRISIRWNARISRRFPGREHKIRELLSRRTQQNRSKMKSRQSRKPGKAENSCRFGKFWSLWSFCWYWHWSCGSFIRF